MTVTGGDIIIQGLEAWAAGTVAALQGCAQEIAELLEAYAKANHPWQNQTGDTEASITGQIADMTDEMIVIVVSAGMDYDVFLELAHEGKWAWLWPCLVACQDRIRQILNRVGNGGTGSGSSVRRIR